jgi:two-component system alkaline phosphatase synthesis response regulator PhoP
MTRPVIFLVDDNKLFLQLEKDFLKELDASIYTAGDGREALELMKVMRPDLVLLDLHMPLMDGADCCLAMKKDPKLRAIPVVIVSNLESENDRERSLGAGCDGVLAKPVGKKEILACCRKFLGKRFPIEQRVLCRTQVVFKSGKRVNYGMSEDIGPKGIFIGFTGDMTAGERVQLNFVLPGMPGELIETMGRVAKVVKAGSVAEPGRAEGFEVDFLELDERARRLIGEYIARS